MELLLLWLYSPLLGLGRSFSFFILYTVGRTPWTGDQPVTIHLHTHRINAHKPPCLEWDSNRLSQSLSVQSQFMPLTALPLWSANDSDYYV
jgi:hypothetical protein